VALVRNGSPAETIGTMAVIEGRTNTVTTTVTPSTRRGCPVDPTTHRVYVANHSDDSVSVIDGSATAAIATVRRARR
jgi:YVTN family beta-propeller protein